MMDTAYYRKQVHVWTDLISPAHSVLYSCMSTTKLSYLDELTEKVLNFKDNDVIKSRNEVKPLLEDLVKQGFVVEVHGNRIQTFLQPFLKGKTNVGQQ